MTNQKDKAYKVMVAFYRSCLGKKVTFKDDKIAVAAILQCLINDFSEVRGTGRVDKEHQVLSHRGCIPSSDKIVARDN